MCFTEVRALHGSAPVVPRRARRFQARADVTYVLPVFQRYYRREQPGWETLWDDLAELLQPGRTGRHFMGLLVLVPESVMPGQIAKYRLIDDSTALIRAWKMAVNCSPHRDWLESLTLWFGPRVLCLNGYPKGLKPLAIDLRYGWGESLTLWFGPGVLRLDCLGFLAGWEHIVGCDREMVFVDELEDGVPTPLRSARAGRVFAFHDETSRRRFALREQDPITHVKIVHP